MYSPRRFWTVAVAACLLLARSAWALTATPSTTEGPYYTLSSANNADKSHFTGEGIDNDLTHIYSSSTQCTTTSSCPLFLLSGTLVNTSGTAIAGATIELWEADSGGIYWYTSSSSTTNAYANRDKNFQGYGQCVTDSSGAWSFRTIKPGLYVGRIRHFHIKVRIDGTEYLTSQFMFSEDSASFSSDNVMASISSSLRPLVTITPVAGTDSSGNYALVVSGKQIVINYTVSATAPTIATQPSSLSVTEGDSATFSVVASGTSPLTYQWYSGAAAISGATSTSYTIATTTTSDAGSYYVIVTNSAGSATSSTVTLTVNASSTAPSITTQPSSLSVTAGESATFSVAATGTAPLTYQWYKGTSAISGATGASYTIATTTTSDAGTYHVVVTNSVDSVTSGDATLTVSAASTTYTATPSTTEGPYYTLSSANNADKSHFTGEGIDNDLTHIYSTSTQCTTTSSCPLFLLSGTLVNTSGTAIAGATIELWEADSGGIYWYTSSSSTTNAYANRDQNFQGYGQCVTDSSGAWSFRTIKPGLYVGRIRHFHIKVRIDGTEYLTSQFMFSEDSASFDSDNVMASITSSLRPLVTITPVAGTDSSGNYALVVSGKQIVITYTVSATAPTISTQPSSLSVTAGQGATFSVTASGTAPLAYQWYQGTDAISGATSSSYAIATTNTSDAGTYHVVVTNSAGSVTSDDATLTVTTLYENYAATYGLDLASTGAPEADADADGLSNLLEFVLLGDPTVNDASSIAPVSNYTTDTVPPYLIISFLARTELGSVTYAVEYSTDLTTWTTAASGTDGVTVASVDQGDGTTLVTAQIPSEGQKIFARLNVSP